ncbi:MAG: aat [Planctomycetota bacterium]|nr:aat [Planctomycetota bacterium]
MPIYRLDRRPLFPPPEHAEPDGLLAVGGDLSVPRLLEAYRNGIFPWFEPGEELLWWSPDPRLILEPEQIQVSRSLRATIRKGTYEVRFDTAFRRVIHACAATPRRHEDGTWISNDIELAYSALHDLGFAHSVESWSGDDLVGGLYGLCLGRAFFGESMFSLRPDASKVALVALGDACRQRGVTLIDCQITSAHLLSLGAREIPRDEFLARVRDAVKAPNPPGSWTKSEPS